METKGDHLNLKTGIYVKELIKADNSRWKEYVEGNPSATFYHRIEWKEIIEKTFGHKTYYLMALQTPDDNSISVSRQSQGVSGEALNPTNSINSTNPINPINSINPINPVNSAMRYAPCAMRDSERVVGILPMVHIKSLIFGSIFCSMPFLNFGGVCADNAEVEKLLISEGEKVLRDQKGNYLELRHLKQSSVAMLNKTHKVSMTLELNQDPEVLWNKFTTKHRTNIRRAGKNELEIKIGKRELLKDFYNIMCHGWRDLGTPVYPVSFFSNIMDQLEDSSEIYVVLHRGVPIATAFNGLYKDTVEGMWASSIREFAKLQANYFLYWEMIKRACLQGYKWYHLGRSTAESGGELFKEKWNAIPKLLYWEYILNKRKEIPELNVDNPKYQLAIRLWKRLPVGLTQKIGPYLAKNIP